jgi:Fur family transcriptional regulator, stress-responsive regulator
MHVEPATFLRDSGLRVTKQRIAVLDALADAPHSGAEAVLRHVRAQVGQVSTQAVYDVLHTLTDRGLVRRIQPAGSTARYELRVGDNHHHLVCRHCGAVADIECATRQAPCLEAADLDLHAPGFVVDEAEVTFWGVCSSCSDRPDRPDQPGGHTHG